MRRSAQLTAVTVVLTLVLAATPALVRGQNVSGVRGLGGGVGVLFDLVGQGNLYVDTQGTQGFMYNFGTFESYSFHNPTTGVHWSGALMTMGPQLSIGLIQGGLQVGSPVVLPPPPRPLPALPEIESTLLDIP